MERHLERHLEILQAIGEGRPLTQRDLARRLGVALGLTNLYLKRLAKKGYIKVVEFPRKPAARKRLRYLLTPKGLGEKTRLSYEHARYALGLYQRTRQTLREALGGALRDGTGRIALYGTGEAAELAYLTLRELGLEPVAVFAPEGGGRFLGLPVRGVEELPAAGWDRLVLATFESPEPLLARIRARGIPADRLVPLRPARGSAPAAAASARRGPA